MNETLEALRQTLRLHLARDLAEARRWAEHHSARACVLAEALERFDAGCVTVIEALCRELEPKRMLHEMTRPTASAVAYGIAATEAEASSWVAERLGRNGTGGRAA